MQKKGSIETYVYCGDCLYRVRTKPENTKKKRYRLSIRNEYTGEVLKISKIKAFRGKYIHDVIESIATTTYSEENKYKKAKQEREAIFERQIKQYTNREYRRGNLDKPYSGDSEEFYFDSHDEVLYWSENGGLRNSRRKSRQW